MAVQTDDELLSSQDTSADVAELLAVVSLPLLSREKTRHNSGSGLRSSFAVVDDDMMTTVFDRRSRLQMDLFVCVRA